MRAPRPAPAPYTPKRALNSGSSAGAAAALGIQKLAGKNDLFAFSSAFLTGYLAGIPLGRFELHGAFTSLTEHVMAAQSYTAFWSVWCSWFAAAVFHKVVRELSSLRYPLAATRIALRGLCALASCFYLRQRPDF